MDAYCATDPDCSEADGPIDADGHGSHTASTTAGNILDFNGDGSRGVSGVAPHANIITYDVCAFFPRPIPGGNLCVDSAVLAAADQAILDGVDAINFSIGGGTAPWSLGQSDRAFLDLVDNGVFVSASAGNDGPDAASVAHLGPWVTTVGASTHHRDVADGSQTGIENQLINMTGGISPPADISGTSRSGNYGPAPIVYAGNYANGDINPQQCLSPFPPGTWGNQIVVCDRGAIARVMKCQNVADGGAMACVLANPSGSAQATASDAHIIPAIHIDATDGDSVRSWLSSGTGHMATITATTLTTDPAQADIMASFSSRGPNTSFSVLKPDVTNPGVLIYAAVQDGALDEPGLPPFRGLEMALFDGTSMSSPHTAGSGALIRSLHSSWTPMQIKSALMMTADTTVKKENGTTDADPFDMGAGRVDLSKAARVGLVLEETHPNFLAADPDLGGRPQELNLASLQQNTCVLDCSWNRTFTVPVTTFGPQGAGVSWTVSSSSNDGVVMVADPSAFQIDTGGSQTLELTASAPSLNPGDPTAFAKVMLTPNDGSPDLHLPVAVTMATNNYPDPVHLVTEDPVDSADIPDLEYYQAISDLVIEVSGIVPGTETPVLLNQDPTNGNPYDNLNQVYVETHVVPIGAKRLVVMTESDAAPDVDLYVGTGSTPSSQTEVCASTTATATESCDLAAPAAGTWWVLVQNWSGSDNQPDLIHLLDAVVPNSDSGDLVVIGPTAVPASSPFTLNAAWNLPDSSRTPWFGTIGLSPDGVGSPTTTFRIDIELVPIFADGFESGDRNEWTLTTP